MKSKAWLLSLLVLMTSCAFREEAKFAAEAPVKQIVSELPFPEGLIYQASPDATVILGLKKIAPALFDVGGYDLATAEKLWQLDFPGQVVGGTATQVLVYQEGNSTI